MEEYETKEVVDKYDPEEVDTEVVDPEAPVKYLRLYTEDEELALIPWSEAELIAEAVEEENNRNEN